MYLIFITRKTERDWYCYNPLLFAIFEIQTSKVHQARTIIRFIRVLKIQNV